MNEKIETITRKESTGSLPSGNKAIQEKATSELTSEEQSFCHSLFINYYKEEYGKQDPKTFEFNLDNLEEWLTSQLKEKIGDRCLISDKGFLSFSIIEETSTKENYVNIFQFVLNKEEASKITGSALFLKELGKKYPNRSFRSAIRKTQKDKARMYVGMGCKVTEDVNLPGFSSDYYLGVEMPSKLIKTLSIFLPKG